MERKKPRWRSERNLLEARWNPGFRFSWILIQRRLNAQYLKNGCAKHLQMYVWEKKKLIDKFVKLFAIRVKPRVLLYNRRVFIRKYVDFALLCRPRVRRRRNLNADYRALSRPLCLLLISSSSRRIFPGTLKAAITPAWSINEGNDPAPLDYSPRGLRGRSFRDVDRFRGQNTL